MSISDYKGVFVFTEMVEGVISEVSLELVGEGKRLAEDLKTEVTAVILGDGKDQPLDELSKHGADKIITVWGEGLTHYLPDSYSTVLRNIVEECKPEIFLFGATHIGRDLAPRLSAKLRTGLTADCTRLAVDEETNNLLMTRPAFGGNLMATIVCGDTRPQMATVRPGVMQKMTVDGNKAEVINKTYDIPKDRVEVLETVKLKSTKKNIKDAKVLVSGGRGMGSPEKFQALENIANLLGGSVSSSRAAVDVGWVGKDHQVGQTGQTVRPDLYIACGISGAIQHLAGMEESELIIAINKDPNAPIFSVADLGIVGDMNKILPQLETLIKETIS